MLLPKYIRAYPSYLTGCAVHWQAHQLQCNALYPLAADILISHLANQFKLKFFQLTCLRWFQSENAGLLALTRVGSRRVIKISACFMIFFSLFGRLSHSLKFVVLSVFNVSWLWLCLTHMTCREIWGSSCIYSIATFLCTVLCPLCLFRLAFWSQPISVLPRDTMPCLVAKTFGSLTL